MYKRCNVQFRFRRLGITLPVVLWLLLLGAGRWQESVAAARATVDPSTDIPASVFAQKGETNDGNGTQSGKRSCYRADGIVADSGRVYPHTLCFDFSRADCGLVLDDIVTYKFDVYECSPQRVRFKGTDGDYTFIHDVELRADSTLRGHWTDSNGRSGTTEGELIEPLSGLVEVEWSGIWKTNIYELRLEQYQDRVTGKFVTDGGATSLTIEGRVEGNNLTGRYSWIENLPNSDTGDSSGTFKWELVTNDEFTGTWTQMRRRDVSTGEWTSSSPDDRGAWFGERVAALTGDPSFLSVDDEPISGSLQMGSMVHVGAFGHSNPEEIVIELERLGGTQRDRELYSESFTHAVRLAGKSSFHEYSHRTRTATAVSNQGDGFFGFGVLREGDRLRLVQHGDNKNYESGWYEIKNSLALRNFRFTMNTYSLQPRAGLKVIDNAERYYAEHPPASVVVGGEGDQLIRLVGDVTHGDKVRSTNQRYSLDGGLRIEDVPASIPVQVFVARDETIISETIEHTLYAVADRSGSFAFYVGDEFGFDDFPVAQPNVGDYVTARIDQVFDNSPVETSIRVGPSVEDLDSCDSDLIRDHFNSHVKFYTYKASAHNLPEAKEIKPPDHLKVGQPFYVEVEASARTECSSGWIELVEEDNDRNKFTRHRVRVEEIGRKQSTRDFRSSQLRLSYSEEVNSIRVARAELYTTNQLWGLAGESDRNMFQRRRSADDLGTVFIDPALGDGEGFLSVFVRGKNGAPPTGVIVITGEDDFTLYEHDTSWDGGVPTGSYQIEYEVMGERFGVNNIVVTAESQRNVAIGGPAEFGSASIADFPRSFSTMKRPEQRVMVGLECQYSRNGVTSDDSCISAQLHQGLYTISLNGSEGLLFPIPDVHLTVSPNTSTYWTSPVGILLLNQSERTRAAGIVNAARIISDDGSIAPLFAIREDTAKLLPVGSYTVELQEAGVDALVVERFVINPNEVTTIVLNTGSEPSQ